MIETLPRIIHVERSMIIGQQDEVLFVQRALHDSHDAGLWELPGGKLDEGEDQETGRVREIFEETGLITATIFPDIVDRQVDMSVHHSGELREYYVRVTMARHIGGLLIPNREEVANVAMMPPLIALDSLKLTEPAARTILTIGQQLTERCL